MAKAARKNDSVSGTFHGEHGGHIPPHDSGPISGSIQTGSPDVFINGIPAARKDLDYANISDEDDNESNHTIIEGSPTVFINNKSAAREGDQITPHRGDQIKISSGSSDVEIGN